VENDPTIHDNSITTKIPRKIYSNASGATQNNKQQYRDKKYKMQQAAPLEQVIQNAASSSIGTSNTKFYQLYKTIGSQRMD